MKFLKREYFLLLAILVVGFWLRLYQINAPLADWHSWRQADTAAVSRNFIKMGFDVLHPRFDDLSSVASGKENPQGYRFVEFPVYNLLHAGLYKLFPQRPLEWWGRMLSIVASLGSMIVLYFLVKNFTNSKIGLLAAFFFAVLPYNIYYSRVILPEPMMLFTSLLMIYLFAAWVDKESIFYLLLAVIFAALSFLLKPFAVFLMPPLVYLAFRKWGFGLFKKLPLYLALVFSLAPLAFWRLWMKQFPEGIPAYQWLLNHEGIRFKGAYFRWLYGERLGKLILGFWGLVLFVLGLIVKPSKKEGWFFYSWLAAIVLYLAVFASGNVRHDYYQIMAIPIICVFLAKGASFLLQVPRAYFSRLFSYLVFLASILFMLAFSWYEIRGFFNINHPEIVEAGKLADKILPPSAKVVAPYNGDTAFLYQINRQGWPCVTISIDFLISRGATHYVSVSFDEQTRQLMEEFTILEKTDRFVIIDLTLRK